MIFGLWVAIEWGFVADKPPEILSSASEPENLDSSFDLS